MLWTGKKWTPLILIGGIYMALNCMKESKCFTRVSGGLSYAASGSCYCNKLGLRKKQQWLNCMRWSAQGSINLVRIIQDIYLCPYIKLHVNQIQYGNIITSPFFQNKSKHFSRNLKTVIICNDDRVRQGTTNSVKRNNTWFSVQCSRHSWHRP